MIHLKWTSHVSTIYNIQKSLHEEQHDCDVTLVAKQTSVRAHRFILSTCSDLLRAALSDVPLGQDTTIVIPDIKGSLLESVLAFVYLGETCQITSNLKEFMEAINVLGIKAEISYKDNTENLQLESFEIPEDPDDIVEQEQIVNVNIEDKNIINDEHVECDSAFLNTYNGSPRKFSFLTENVSNSIDSEEEFILPNNTSTLTLSPSIKEEYARSMIEVNELELKEQYNNEDNALIETMVEISSLKKRSKSHKKTNKKSNKVCETMSKTFGKKPLNFKSLSSSHQMNDEDPMQSAVQAVVKNGSSLRKAAVNHGVAVMTLWRRIRQQHPYYSSKIARKSTVDRNSMIEPSLDDTYTKKKTE